MAGAVVLAVSMTVSLEAAGASTGSSGVEYDIHTVCSTGSMTGRADATSLSGPGSVNFVATANGAQSTQSVSRGGRASVTVRGNSAIPAGLQLREAGTPVAAAQYAQTCTANPAAAFDSASYFVALSPKRVLDTRPGTTIGYVGNKPLADSILTVPLAGLNGIAANATAVFVNITATDATGPGYVQAFPNGRGILGSSSNVNVEYAGQTIPNAAIVRLGVDGAIGLYSTMSTNLIVDIAGYFVPAVHLISPPVVLASTGRFKGVTPTRVFDSRPQSAVQYTGPKPAAGSTVELAVFPTAQRPLVPLAPNTPQASILGSVILNVTATQSNGPGFVQVAPGGALVPGAASNLNVNQANQTIPNLVIVPLSAAGTVSIFTSGGAHLIVDVLGYFTNSSAPTSVSGIFVPVDPERVLDTRPATRIDGALFDGTSLTSTTVFFDGLTPNLAGAVVLSVVATQTGGPGFVQVGPSTMTLGAHSNLNFEHADQTIPNLVVAQSAQLGVDGVKFFVSGRTQLVADIAGWFTFSISG